MREWTGREPAPWPEDGWDKVFERPHKPWWSKLLDRMMGCSPEQIQRRMRE